jgi:hypothetical protein
MLATQKFFKLMSPFLVLMGLSGGIERFVTIGCHLDREVKNVKRISIAQEKEESNNDPDCMRRGCEPARFV